MARHTSRFLLTSLSLLISGTALADSHYGQAQSNFQPWHVGIIGGLGADVVKNEAEYDNTGQSTSQSLDTSTFSPSFKTGLEIGHHWALNAINSVGLSVNANYAFGEDISEVWHITSTTATSDPMDLKRSIKPRWQFNAVVDLQHQLNPMFSIGINAGFSVLNTRTKLSITDVGVNTGSSQAASSVSETNTLYGGLVGLETAIHLSQSSSIGLNLDYYVYATKNLKTVNDIDTGTADQLKERKLTLMEPSVSLAYNYHF